MGKFLIYIVAFLVSISIITACNSGECLDNKSSIPLAGIYSAVSKSAISIDSITVYGLNAPKDSMILKVGKGIKQLYLPFRINTNETTYVIHYDQKSISDIANNDTLNFKYTSTPYFSSAECGVYYIFEITEFTYTKHIIDSVAVPIPKITNLDKETISLYMRTQKPTKAEENVQ